MGIYMGGGFFCKSIDALVPIGHILDSSTQVIPEKGSMQCLSGMVGKDRCCSIGLTLLHECDLSPGSFLVDTHVETGQTCLDSNIRLAFEHLCGILFPYAIRR